MTGLRRYVSDLATSQRVLQEVALRLGDSLTRLAWTQQLDEVSSRVRQHQSYIVVDWDASFPVRSARAWAVVGGGGIPDDVEVVGENMRISDDQIFKPDLNAPLSQGKVLIAGDEFLDLVARLKREVTDGRALLPYHPRSGETGTSEHKGAY